MTSRRRGRVDGEGPRSSERFVRETTILLADDHARLLMGVKRLLESQFRVVGAVADGSALIEAALALRPRVVVTDLIMEPTSGLEAAEAILARCRPRPAIVMLTAIADEEIARRAFAAGILGFVSKTRLAEDLIPAIEAALDGSQFRSPLSDLDV